MSNIEIVYEPIPLPPSLIKGRGELRKRGASPLSKVSFPSPLAEVKLTGRLRGASAPLVISLPLSLRRRGGLRG